MVKLSDAKDIIEFSDYFSKIPLSILACMHNDIFIENPTLEDMLCNTWSNSITLETLDKMNEYRTKTIFKTLIKNSIFNNKKFLDDYNISIEFDLINLSKRI